jgi:hypothetical protein
MTTLNELVNTAPATPVITVANPLDMPVTMFSDALQRRGDNRTALVEWVKKALVDGMDFGAIQTKRGMSRPSLRKAGAEKICGMLGLSVQFPNLEKYEDAAINGVEIKQIIIRCELRDNNGHLMAAGIGARSVATDGGDLNKALKMAAKSAQIDATLRCAGLSEVFTQDIEDMPKSIIEGEVTHTVQTATPKEATAKDYTPTLSTKQVSRLHAIMRQHGITNTANANDFITRMKKAYNIQHTDQLNREQYEQVCNVSIPWYGDEIRRIGKSEGLDKFVARPYKPYIQDNSDREYDAARDAGAFDGDRKRAMYARD